MQVEELHESDLVKDAAAKVARAGSVPVRVDRGQEQPAQGAPCRGVGPIGASDCHCHH